MGGRPTQPYAEHCVQGAKDHSACSQAVGIPPVQGRPTGRHHPGGAEARPAETASDDGGWLPALDFGRIIASILPALLRSSDRLCCLVEALPSLKLVCVPWPVPTTAVVLYAR